MPISDWSSDVCSSDLVAELACLGEVAGALRLVQRAARGVELLLDPGLGVDLVLFGLPPLSEFGRLLFEVGEFGLERGQPVLRRCRKSVVYGQSVSGRVDLGARRIIQKNNH